MYSKKLGQYLAANHPGVIAQSHHGSITIKDWPEQLGKPPTPEEVAAWTPTPPEPVDHALAVAGKIEASKSGTQAAKIAALTEAVEALQAALVARRLL